MPGTIINPTRMELTRLKRQLKTAQRGHKLLRDKRDELMKQFMDIVRENRALRSRVEEGLMQAHGSFTVASALMTPEMLRQSLLVPVRSVQLDMSFENIMSVDVPRYHFTEKQEGSGYPYGFAQTSGELDDAVEALSGVFRDMLRLAEVEKTTQLLAEEIEKTRRRVNALEYVMIPNTKDAIRYISMKLDENDRSTTTRLMKVKDMLLAQAIEDDDVYWSDAAEEAGMTVEQYKQFQRLQRENAQLIEQERVRQGREATNRQVQEWYQQAEETKKTYPSFDLAEEVQNPQFLSLLQANVPVRHAYEVIHMDAIKAAERQLTARATEQQVTANVRARGARPTENGTASQGGFTIKSDPSKWSKKDRAEVVRKVQRGEKVYL